MLQLFAKSTFLLHISPKQISNPKILFTTRNLLRVCEKSVRISSRCKRYSIWSFSNMEQFFLPKNPTSSLLTEKSIQSDLFAKIRTGISLYPRGFSTTVLGLKLLLVQWQRNEKLKKVFVAQHFIPRTIIKSDHVIGIIKVLTPKSNGQLEYKVTWRDSWSKILLLFYVMEEVLCSFWIF